uniref:Uncharacterized protein n=1 Tax=Panagrolaimus sp. ES5 TaxID=591445 RepID=A0AC34GXJ3_9BILA
MGYECWHSRLKTSKIPKTDLNEAKEYIKKLRLATPIVWWKSVCYHYLRRSRQVTRYRNGDAITATQIYYERVNSHTAGNVFMFDTCGFKDISKNLESLERYPMIKIKFSKGFVFACVQAANEFEEQRTRFFNENEVKDDYMEVREGLDLVEIPFIEHMIAYTNPGLQEPWYLRASFYWFFSALLLSWPLRMFEEYNTAHIHYHATKLFGTNYLSPSSMNYTGPLTRTSTMESTELERALRENFLMVPSYSEAVFLDPVSYTNTLIFPNIRNRILCNENVITNYGAVNSHHGNNNHHQPRVRPPPPAFSTLFTARNLPSRSKSMSFNNHERAPISSAAIPVPRPSELILKNVVPAGKPPQPSRSISIAGICGTTKSSGYHSQSNTPATGGERIEERRPLIEPMSATMENEPPPSYEVALRMCAPIYNRIRQSANSISSLLNALSRSNSRDLRQYSLDGPPA